MGFGFFKIHEGSVGEGGEGESLFGVSIRAKMCPKARLGTVSSVVGFSIKKDKIWISFSFPSIVLIITGYSIFRFSYFQKINK